MVQQLRKIVQQFLKQLNVELLNDPAIPLISVYTLKRNENICLHKNLYINVQAALFIINLEVETSWWMDKQNTVYAYNEVFFSYKKRYEVLMHGTTWMNLENIMVS